MKWDHSDRSRPPRHGPHAKAVWTGSKWKMTLLPSGVAVVEEFLTRFPQPARILNMGWRYKSLLLAACKRFGVEQVNAAAGFGLCSAVVHFDESVSPQVDPLAVRHIAFQVQRLNYELKNSKHEWDFGDLPARPELPYQEETTEQELARILEEGRQHLTPRQFEVLRLMSVYGQHQAVARQLGITREGARQIYHRAVAALRAVFGEKPPAG